MKNIILILTISILFPQNLETFTQKINLENSLRNKIYSELERNFDKNDRFVVIVNLEISRYGDLMNDSKNKNSNLDSREMEYLPGVPLSGSNGSNTQQTSPRQANANDFVISEIDIEVWVEPTFNNEKMLESLIKGVIPDIAPCDNCVRIQAMNFNTQTNKEDSEFEKLKKELEEIKNQARQDEMTELKLKINEIYKLENDSKYIEKVDRGEFSIADPGEKIYRVENEKHYENLGRDNLEGLQIKEEREQEFQSNKEPLEPLEALREIKHEIGLPGLPPNVKPHIKPSQWGELSKGMNADRVLLILKYQAPDIDVISGCEAWNYGKLGGGYLIFEKDKNWFGFESELKLVKWGSVQLSEEALAKKVDEYLENK